MKQRAKIQSVAASVLIVALFLVIWKVSAPIRIRRQINQQASLQLRGAITANGDIFKSFNVKEIHYDFHTNSYSFQYLVEWNPYSTSLPSAIQSGGDLYGSGRKYFGRCVVVDRSGVFAFKTITLEAVE